MVVPGFVSYKEYNVCHRNFSQLHVRKNFEKELSLTNYCKDIGF